MGVALGSVFCVCIENEGKYIMKYSVKYEVEVDSEIQSLVEKLDDAFESVTEEFIADLASRHYSDWIGSGMSVKLYETMEADILRRALRVILKRWEENE